VELETVDAEEGEKAKGRCLKSVLPMTIKRSKPFEYAYEKEIVMYAYFKVRFSSFPLPSLVSSF